MMSKTILSIFLTMLLMSVNLFAVIPITPGTPVIDATAIGKMVEQIKAMEDQLNEAKKVTDAIGNRKLNPDILGEMNYLYNKCGGRKFVLPNFLPDLKFSFCEADAQDKVKKYFEKEYMYKINNTHKEHVKKRVKQEKHILNMRNIAFTASTMGMKRAEENIVLLNKFIVRIGAADNQIALQKVQMAIQVEMLSELQQIDKTQSIVLHIMAIK